MVLVTELTKLFLATGIYLCQGHSLVILVGQLWSNRSLALFYLVPAILYCIYNNLTYVNLSFYDPTTYYILLQLRIAVTGVVYQIIFQRYLSRTQWLSLLLLTVGCIIKQLGNFDFSQIGNNSSSFFNSYLLLVAVQVSQSECYYYKYYYQIWSSNYRYYYHLSDILFMFGRSIQ